MRQGKSTQVACKRNCQTPSGETLPYISELYRQFACTAAGEAASAASCWKRTRF